MLYLWLKAFHIIFMVAWFAGLFYIFRLFVYHAKYRDQANLCQAYQVMERKLLYMIMHPAMLLTILFGGLLISLNPAVLRAPWFHLKLLAVAGLIGYQIFCGVVAKRFARGDFFLSERACRFLNEVPTVLLIVIVIMVVVKPGS